jgi:hypothetical protein
MKNAYTPCNNLWSGVGRCLPTCGFAHAPVELAPFQRQCYDVRNNHFSFLSSKFNFLQQLIDFFHSHKFDYPILAGTREIFDNPTEFFTNWTRHIKSHPENALLSRGDLQRSLRMIMKTPCRSFIEHRVSKLLKTKGEECKYGERCSKFHSDNNKDPLFCLDFYYYGRCTCSHLTLEQAKSLKLSLDKHLAKGPSEEHLARNIAEQLAYITPANILHMRMITNTPTTAKDNDFVEVNAPAKQQNTLIHIHTQPKVIISHGSAIVNKLYQNYVQDFHQNLTKGIEDILSQDFSRADKDILDMKVSEFTSSQVELTETEFLLLPYINILKEHSNSNTLITISQVSALLSDITEFHNNNSFVSFDQSFEEFFKSHPFTLADYFKHFTHISKWRKTIKHKEFTTLTLAEFASHSHPSELYEFAELGLSNPSIFPTFQHFIDTKRGLIATDGGEDFKLAKTSKSKQFALITSGCLLFPTHHKSKIETYYKKTITCHGVSLADYLEFSHMLSPYLDYTRTLQDGNTKLSLRDFVANPPTPARPQLTRTQLTRPQLTPRIDNNMDNRPLQHVDDTDIFSSIFNFTDNDSRVDTLQISVNKINARTIDIILRTNIPHPEKEKLVIQLSTFHKTKAGKGRSPMKPSIDKDTSNIIIRINHGVKSKKKEGQSKKDVSDAIRLEWFANVILHMTLPHMPLEHLNVRDIIVANDSTSSFTNEMEHLTKKAALKSTQKFTSTSEQSDEEFENEFDEEFDT